METLNLAVGQTAIALNFRDNSQAEEFREYFLRRTTEEIPQLEIDIAIGTGNKSTDVPNSLFLTKKKVLTGGFSAGDGLIRGKYHKKTGRWSFSIDRILVTGDFRRVFEQILYQAYNSVSSRGNTILVHSSGVIKDGYAYLFVGPSEAGKSTVAALSSSYDVLNDEINIIDLNGDIPVLEGTPFNGLFRTKKPGRAHLKGIFILHKAPYHGAEKIAGGKAVKPLAGEIIPPIGLHEYLDNKTYIMMMDKALEIASKVPLYRLDFLPDRGFWDILEKL